MDPHNFEDDISESRRAPLTVAHRTFLISVPNKNAARTLNR